MQIDTVIVTGGYGFIGSALVKSLLKDNVNVINIDKLTYAANPDSLDSIKHLKNYHFEKCDICDSAQVEKILAKYRPNGVFHLAAESHVDNSIKSPNNFINTNILGTYSLLNCCKHYLDKYELNTFKFLHISTDEVFGSLDINDKDSFTEESPYRPNSPYSASKASSDMLVRAWNKTFDFPTIISNCSNNFGIFQNKEKLIPKVVVNAIRNYPIPIYGDGKNIRDWLYVEDHVEALKLIFSSGKIGESYNIGTANEIDNITLVKKILDLLNDIAPKTNGYKHLIEYVSDRPGHDKKYSINPKKMSTELKWTAKYDFDKALEETIKWYVKKYDK